MDFQFPDGMVCEKLQLLRMMDKFNEDGYQIVQDYLDSLSEAQRKSLTFAERHCENDVSSVFLFTIT